jgi:translocation and assembly module TamB
MASVEPTDNQLNLNIDVQNEGIGLLNLFTDGQVSWVNGTGDVRLQVNGTYDQNASRLSQLVAQGVASVENATIQARSLPEPLTNVTGRVLFNLDNIQVESVQGQFSGGIITAAGTIPISRFVPQDNPLTINIGELALNLKGLYSGRVQGGVVIAGTALAPSISGEVNLFNGQVKLAQTGAESAGGGGGGTAGQAAANNSVEFNGLKLTLGKDIQITQNPILGFLANGTLTLNGSLDNLRPEGTIELQRGEVNLFTTQFRLARGYENTAKFLPNRGLDPILDVRLQASVAETTQRRLPTDPLSAEISDVLVTNFGTLQSVRIQARVEGPASQIADNLELTSTPSRSEAEIVALLGGRFVDTLGRGDTTLGLVNLAGSALLSNVQNVIGDALGLSEFRLFPTIIRNDEKRTSSLGLAAEAGIDITRNISVSVSKELTTDQPFQYSLRYRLNENLRVRGLTDLSGESGAIVEYERRF